MLWDRGCGYWKKRESVALRETRRIAPGDAAKHGAISEAAAAGIVEVEHAGSHLARGVEAGQRSVGHVDDLRLGIDLDATKGEGDAASDAVRLERAVLDGVRPVRFRHREALRATAVEHVGI